MTRRRLNQMRFCECRHGQGAHRNGRGPCFGERMIVGVWTPCKCLEFVAERQPADETQHIEDRPND